MSRALSPFVAFSVLLVDGRRSPAACCFTNHMLRSVSVDCEVEVCSKISSSSVLSDSASSDEPVDNDSVDREQVDDDVPEQVELEVAIELARLNCGRGPAALKR